MIVSFLRNTFISIFPISQHVSDSLSGPINVINFILKILGQKLLHYLIEVLSRSEEISVIDYDKYPSLTLLITNCNQES
jgi:hypothetical protein